MIAKQILLQRRRLLAYLGMGVSTFSIASVFEIEKLTVANAESPQDRQTLPEFQGIDRWLNSSPLDVRQLQGKVVLIQFWTFACINCQRTLPYITKWHEQYAERGLQIVGIHTPEFIFERDPNNVKQALKKHQILYPVGMDNEYKTWNAYKNEYWPRLYLADRQGIIQFNHIGEGAYPETEQKIRQLLG
jgi:thiol-disulfide isomerase/thioredoxin